MSALILEPERWERPALLELELSLHGGLTGIMAALRSGAAFESGFIPTPEPVRLEAALGLLEAVNDLHGAAEDPTSPVLTLVRLVNLQYQTFVAVTALVPGRSISEGNRMRKAKPNNLQT
ncbi:MAG TPA: hypothetical protein VGS23_04025 [Thermoplasmata archaeon]|nr:hypothetical protein [Thermoplasmata archaeon]